MKSSTALGKTARRLSGARSWLVPLVLALIFGTGARSAPPPATAPFPGYDLRGEIVGVSAAKGILLVHHEEIPGFMPAMTMEFTAPGFDFSKFREGQRIAARMTEGGPDHYQLERVRILPSPADHAVVAAALALRRAYSA